MAEPARRQLPRRYQLRVDGHLDAHWAAWFDDLTLARHGDGTTTFTGVIQDQAQLHGLLAKVRDLGLPLISTRVLDETQIDASAEEEDW
jgi:hypothetical protein